MGLMDELKKLTRPYPDADEEDDYTDDYDDDDQAETTTPPASTTTTKGTRSPFSSPTITDTKSNQTSSGGHRPTVVNLPSNVAMQVILVKPDRFDNVTEIADHLRDKKSVVLNLESTNKDVARRLVDFLSGVAYALEGKIKKVAISTYILTPYNVEILGDLVEELENNGVYF